MQFLKIFARAFLIGFSGAMMPGPMLGVTIEESLRRKKWTAGPLIVLGHGILELTLVIFMTFGLRDFFSNPTVAGIIGLCGGAYLAWMGCGMVKSGLKKAISIQNQNSGNHLNLGSLVLTGIIVSATNPYFIIWWASTGLESVRQAYDCGVACVLLFFCGHVLSDFAWYTSVSAAFAGGRKLIGDTVYCRIILVLGIFISAFSVYFVIGGFRMIFFG